MRLRIALGAALSFLSMTASAFSAPNTFTASTNKHYWLMNGMPFVTVGYNRYDVWNASDPANDGLTPTQYVQRIAQNGGNLIRVWAEQGDQNANGDFYLEYPAGTYREAQALRLDELFNAADTYGAYVEICSWDTYNVKHNFAAFADNSSHGAPIST